MDIRRCIALALACVAGQAASAAEPGPVAPASPWTANLRYRHESVDDDAYARRAAANTLRLRLGWSHLPTAGFAYGLEGEGVAELGDRFNSGANGETSFPIVADARALELNQAWLGWRGKQASATLGRQRVVLDNQRYVGNVGWRQNEQTFDALALEARPHARIAARYYWLDRVHKVGGDDAIDPLARERNLDAHLGNVAWTLPVGVLVGYAYLVEDRDLASASTQSSGLRWTGSHGAGASTLGWSLEAAGQRDYGNNPRDIDVDYRLAELSLTRAGITGKLGWEQLGSDGGSAFQTPLATLHAFNGWADKFLTTPVNGLDDRYLLATGKFGHGRLADKLAWTLAWHDYRAERGGASYGSEWNASLGFPLPAGLTGLVKLADYRSDGFARDTLKAWFQVEWSY